MFSPDGRYLLSDALIPGAMTVEGTYLVDTLSGEVAEIAVAETRMDRRGDATFLVAGSRDVGWTVAGSTLVMRDANGDPSESTLIATAPDGSRQTEIGHVPRSAMWTTEAPP